MTIPPVQLPSWPLLGCGVGLRTNHFEKILTDRPLLPAVDWFEATTENFMNSGGRPLWVLEQVRRNYPIVLHGVSLSIGSVDPLNSEYLARWKALVDRIDPAMVSDHLCWASVENKNYHDLLPLPFTEEALRHIVERVGQAQDFLGRRILLENVSSYISYKHSAMTEWDFLAEVSRRSGCGILLDINNIYVNAVNHGFSPQDFLRGVPAEAVGYCHLAGHTHMGKWLFDTHSRPVIEPVWDLYRDALALFGKKSTLVEWDEEIPEWDRLAAEAARAREIYLAAPDRSSERVLRRREAPSHNDGGMTLAEVQRWMRRRIYPEQTECPPDLPQDDGLGAVEFNLQGGDPGEERLGVYAGGYAARLTESMKEVYEAVAHVLGESMFAHVAEAYAATRPSTHFDLGLCGRGFSDFLKTARVTEKLPFLPELALLEWRVAEAFHAFDRAALDPAALAGFAPEDWERLVFKFQPSAALMKAAWPVTDIWRARNTPIEEFDLEIANRPQNVLIYRSGFKVGCVALEPEEFRVLEGLKAGRTLGSVCEELAATLPDSGDGEGPVIPLEVWFGRWAGLGLFTSANLEAPHDTANSLLR
jgi:hypothetical protein